MGPMNLDATVGPSTETWSRKRMDRPSALLVAAVRLQMDHKETSLLVVAGNDCAPKASDSTAAPTYHNAAKLLLV